MRRATGTASNATAVRIGVAMTNYFDKAPDHNDTIRVHWWLMWIVGVIIVVSVLVFGLQWLTAPLDTLSPARVQQLSRDANDRYQALAAQHATITTQQAQLREFVTLYGPNRAAWPQGKRDEYQQLAAATRNLVTAYNGACGQYQALWRDAWRDLPAPDDLPRTCAMIDGAPQ